MQLEPPGFRCHSAQTSDTQVTADVAMSATTEIQAIVDAGSSGKCQP
jgi:hypothetical protein